MARSMAYGYDVFWDEDDEEWKYADTYEGIDGNPRPCPHCGRMPPPDGHDGCLGELPGVRFACCGHGRKDGYIIFENDKKVILKNKCE